MTGKYYLSDILTPSRFQSGCINLIRAPVGSGKTHYVFNYLSKSALSNDYILYITDTNMNREQIIATYQDADGYQKDWREFINSQPKNRIGKGWGNFDNSIRKDNKITVMNYAQVAAFINYGHRFDWGQFDYVVCDELHNLIYYNAIKDSILNHTIDKINHTIANCPDVKIIGMTATPNKVFERFQKVYDVLTQQEIDDLFHYEVKNINSYRDYVKILNLIPKGKKGIIYFDRITTLKEVEKILIKRGHRTSSFWSLNNEKHPLNDNQRAVRQHIIDNQLIPPDVDILLINAACQTGVNIKNTDITFMVIHADKYSDTLIQARGRLRNDLDNLHYYDKNFLDKPNPVPAHYLNRKITATELKDLCNEIRYMKPKSNDYYKGKKVIEYLSQHGYRITKTTIGHGGSTRAYLIELIKS